MSNKSNATVATMGIDVDKNSFRVIGLDQRGAVVLRQKRCQIATEIASAPVAPEVWRCHGSGEPVPNPG
jgi:hypothetical protein